MLPDNYTQTKANKLSKGNSYLENAISAQHDGFPSRLLDVTYNSLVALYFACTPYYRKRESEYDDKDGRVFIFFLDKMFCPTGENITNNYNDLILGKENFISYAVLYLDEKDRARGRTLAFCGVDAGAFGTVYLSQPQTRDVRYLYALPYRSSFRRGKVYSK